MDHLRRVDEYNQHSPFSLYTQVGLIANDVLADSGIGKGDTKSGGDFEAESDTRAACTHALIPGMV